MANTGINQAVIAYKVRHSDGAPLDVNGDPISRSGLKQAIYLLVGTANPNPALYQVEGYFNANGTIDGVTTTEYDTEKCPAGVIYVDPIRVVTSPGSPPTVIKLYSDGPWQIIAVPTPYLANVSPGAGGAGFNDIIFEPLAQQGQGIFYFQNIASGAIATVYFINTENPDLWILANGRWNYLGFWKADGLWNY